MQVLLITIVAMATLMALMAIGVVLGGIRLRGSCGGVGGEDCLCDEHGRPKQDHDCDETPHACEQDPASCAFATKACELRHSHRAGGLLAQTISSLSGGRGGPEP